MARRIEPQPALGRAIRRLRNDRKLSQEELGLGAEIHPTWISHIESGRANPAWGTVRRIVRVLDVPLSELVLLSEKLCREEKKRKGGDDA